MTNINQRQFFRCPLETDQPESVLVIGSRRIDCQLIEMSLSGFAVMLPRALPSMKDPVAQLKVGALQYIVRVARQENRDDGVLVALEQLEELLPNNTMIPTTPTSRALTAAAWAAAIGIIVLAGYCMTAAQLPMIASFWE
jgi:hypothetical protein